MVFFKKFLKKFIEKNYKVWGTKLEVDLPPEFIITQHAENKFKQRVCCNQNKKHKIIVKAWNSKEKIRPGFIRRSRKLYGNKIYKLFNGYIFVFDIRYNRKAGFAQKFLITVFKLKGYQIYN